MFLPQKNIVFDIYSLLKNKQIGMLSFVNIQYKQQSN